jgi:flagellar FliL protein
MADEAGQVPETAADAAALEAPAPPRRRRWLLASTVLVLLLGGSGAGFVWFRAQLPAPAEPGAPAVEPSAEHAEAAPAEPPGLRDGIDFNAELGIELPDVASEEKKAEEHGEAGAASPGHLGKIYPLEPFVVNISDRERDRFLKLKTEIELSSSEVAAELDQRLPQIRDLIISLLGAKSFDEVRTIEGKNFLREEMLLRINSLLVTGKAKSIYFTEFVVQ